MNFKSRKSLYSIASIALLLIFIISSTFVITAETATTLSERIQNAVNGDVITLTSDCNEAVTINTDKDITIDLNGFTLTAPGNTVITNNGKLTIKDSAGTGKIVKASVTGDTFGVFNNGTLNVAGGTINISTSQEGISYGINNKGTLSVTGGVITSVTTGSQWAFGIYNTSKITEFSKGSSTGKILNSSNSYNALGISNEAGAVIDLISGGEISSEVNNQGMAYGMRNRGTVKEIKGGTISALTTGAKWSFALWNVENGVVSKISGGTIKAAINNSGNPNNALGISNEAVITSITGGLFYGKINGSGAAYGIRSDKTITEISGGAFMGNVKDNAIFKRNGTLTYANGYKLTDNSVGFRYVMPSDGYFVQLNDEKEEWVATYIYSKSGDLTCALGENLEDSYSVYSWKDNQKDEIVTCTSTDFSAIKENTTLSIKKTDRPVYYFLGSSVTYGFATGGVSFADHMAEANNWICIKRAVSGTTLVDNGADSYVQRMRNQISVNAKVDHFICQLSTNDASQNKPLGTVSSSKNLADFNTSTIIGAMEYIIAYSYQTWDCPVSFYTNPYYSNGTYKKMVDALYELQEKWDIGIIDFYNYKNMDALSSSTLSSYMSDSIHPNTNGYKWMANVMGNYIKNYGKPVDPTPNSPAPATATPTNPASTDPIATEKPGSNDNTPDTGDTIFIWWGMLSIASLAAMTLVYRKNRMSQASK